MIKWVSSRQTLNLWMFERNSYTVRFLRINVKPVGKMSKNNAYNSVCALKCQLVSLVWEEHLTSA